MNWPQLQKKMDWRYTCLDEDGSQPADSTIDVTATGLHISGHLPLKGIALTLHTRCETLSFNFDADGIDKKNCSGQYRAITRDYTPR